MCCCVLISPKFVDSFYQTIVTSSVGPHVHMYSLLKTPCRRYRHAPSPPRRHTPIPHSCLRPPPTDPLHPSPSILDADPPTPEPSPHGRHCAMRASYRTPPPRRLGKPQGEKGVTDRLRILPSSSATSSFLSPCSVISLPSPATAVTTTPAVFQPSASSRAPANPVEVRATDTRTPRATYGMPTLYQSISYFIKYFYIIAEFSCQIRGKKQKNPNQF